MRELCDAAVRMARGAGTIVMRHFRAEGGVVARKSSAIDLVTAADRESEAYVLAQIARQFPDHIVWAEESGKVGRDGPFRWVVDPLDGTSNFAHRLPHFCVLLAVQERDPQGGFTTVVGVTFDPVRDELFVAVRGEGATLHGEKIRVSKVSHLIDAVASTGFAYDRLYNDANNHAEFCRLNLLTQGCRRLGAAGLDLAYTACGRVDLFWEYGLQPWDMAAGVLLVSEAGGLVTGVENDAVDLTRGDVLASNGLLHAAARSALTSASRYPVASREGLGEHLPPEVAAKVKR